MEYVIVINKDGIRQTSYVVGIHGENYESIEKVAKSSYPNCTVIRGDSDMQSLFTDGKAYVNGTFIDVPVEVQEPTRTERIAEIKAYYNQRFEVLEQTLLRRRLVGADITDLQEQFKKLNAEMVKQIKAVK